MRILRGLGATERLSGTAVTVGSFDGVHVGHQALLREAVERGKRAGLVSLAVTFDPHPAAVLSGSSNVACLTTTTEKAGLIDECGVEVLAILAFTRELASLTAAQFVERVLVGCLGLRCLVHGPTHRFGRDGAGTPEATRRIANRLGFEAVCVEPVGVDGEPVSSTRVRQAVSLGRVDAAARMLGRPYAVTGTVVRGFARGRGLGFPTANVSPPPGKLIPAAGIYACRARLESGTAHPGVVYVGQAPTFQGVEATRVECHLLDFDRDLYGQMLRVEFVQHLRDDQTFGAPAELIEQIGRDVARAREVLGG